MVDIFVKNAIVATNAIITVLIDNEDVFEKIIYTFNHGHWTSEKDRKF